MPADQFAIGRPHLLEGAEVFLLVEDVPGHAHDVFRSAAGLRQYCQGVLEGLPELAGKCFILKNALCVESNLARHEYRRSTPDGNAVGKTLRLHPARWLQNFHEGILSLKRCSFPVSVRGSSATNSMARGYL